MGDTGGIGGSKPLEPFGTGEVGEKGGPSKGDIEKALHAKVSTLGELKGVLEKYLGKKDGEKLYNNFIKSFAMMMLTEIQESAEKAKRAAQQARTQNP